MGLISRAADTYYTYRFLRILTQSWEDQPAFKLGIIDKHGKVLRSSKQFTSEAERDAATYFHRVVWNLKRLLEKVPVVGKTKLAPYAASVWLLKESVPTEDQHLFEKILVEYLKSIGQVPCNEPVNESVNHQFINAGTYELNGKLLVINEMIFPVGTIFQNLSIYKYERSVFVKSDLKPILENGDGIPTNAMPNTFPEFETSGGMKSVMTLLKRRKKKKTTKVNTQRTNTNAVSGQLQNNVE